MIKHPTLSPLNTHSKVLYNPVNLDGCVLALTKPYIGNDKWIDFSGDDNDNTIIGAIKHKDGFLYFDNIDDYIQLSKTLTFEHEYTFEFTVNRSDTSTYDFVLGHDSLNGKIGFLANHNNYFVRAFDDGTIDSSVLGLYNEVLHTIITRDSSNKIDLYKNGGNAHRLFDDISQEGLLSINRIGNDQINLFNGTIFKVLCYNRVLSPDEIRQHYLHSYPY